MNQVLAELREEHRLIERTLAVLEALSRGLTSGDDATRATLRMAIEFMRGFADRCHHRKEEQILFPALAAKSPILELGPTRILAGEHDAGRRLVAEMDAAAAAMATGEESGRTRAKHAIDLYTRMLRRHIAKEEEIVFRVADYLISDSEAEALQEQFNAVEAELGPDAHGLYEALVTAMEHDLDRIENPSKIAARPVY